MLEPAQKLKRSAVVVARRPKTAIVATPSASPNGNGWIRWLLLLVAATGLMMVSFASLVGAARKPAGAAAGVPLFRRPRREQIREVVAERVGPPLPLPAVAPAPPREVPPAPARSAPASVAEPTPQPEVQAEKPIADAVQHEHEVVDTEEVPEATEEICEIMVWRGYAKARFYARLDLDETDEFAVAESPSFRFQGNGTPADTEAARAAHRALVEKLRGKGWEKEDISGPWYAARFRRPLERNTDSAHR